LYKWTIARDGDRRQIVGHWDDLNPNRHIVAPFAVAAAELDENRLAHELGRMGFRIVSGGSDNAGRGWGIVAPTRSDLPFYNPIDQSWYAYLDEGAQRAIVDKWPDVDVPGVRL
jgi:hypothetical protein